MSISTTDSTDDPKKASVTTKKTNQNVQGPMTDEEINQMKKYEAYFSVDIDLVTRTIQSDRQYRDKIDPQAILRLNQNVHTMKWNEFTKYIAEQDDGEYMMGIMYQNIFYKDAKVHRLLNKGWDNLDEYECMYVANGYLQKIRINVEKTEHLFVGENLYR